jgi:hypothetical protein
MYLTCVLTNISRNFSAICNSLSIKRYRAFPRLAIKITGYDGDVYSVPKYVDDAKRLKPTKIGAML